MSENYNIIKEKILLQFGSASFKSGLTLCQLCTQFLHTYCLIVHKSMKKLGNCYIMLPDSMRVLFEIILLH